MTITDNAGYEPITKITTPEEFVKELAKTMGFDVELLTSEETSFLERGSNECDVYYEVKSYG
ncbi:MAG: hypothetical protein J7L25_14010 [Deltaproteobacteria bacterium]|nr:hypothetical protein [Candidatus Tharpella aukensis]